MDEAPLTRDQTAEVLTRAGYPVSPKLLANLATKGSGPPYRRFGNRALYDRADALAWAEARLTTPRAKDAMT